MISKALEVMGAKHVEGNWLIQRVGGVYYDVDDTISKALFCSECQAYLREKGYTRFLLDLAAPESVLFAAEDIDGHRMLRANALNEELARAQVVVRCAEGEG